MTDDVVRTIKMSWIWSAVVLVTVILCGTATPWDAITDLLENQGPSEDQAGLLAFVAGYTLPLSAGVAFLAYAAAAGWFEASSELEFIGTVCVVLTVSAVAAQALGLGLLPDTDHLKPISGPWYVAIPGYIFQAYFNAYGWALMVCAVLIGGAGGLHVAVATRRASMSASAPGA